MRKTLGWLGRILLALVVAAALVGVWKREEIGRLMAVNTLFDPDRIVFNFSNMERAFLHTEVPRGDGPVSPLPAGPVLEMPDGYAAWIDARSVTSILVLKEGEIIHEAYYRGTGPDDLRISWSVAKSFLSALFGVLITEGAIDSIDDPVTKYVPVLRDRAYADVTIRNVLNMASGVTFDEDYLDYNSDINRMGRVLALGGQMDAFAAGLIESFTSPGTDWQYVSIDTHVVGMVIRGATGRSIPDLLSEKIIAPLGYEKTPYYVTDGDGVAFVLGGLNVTTRDYARFGQMILQNGRWQGRQIVPEDWIAASTTPSAPTAPGEKRYGYQWWINADARDGEFFAHGIYGQYIYFDRQSDVVIVVTSADRGFREDGSHEANMAMFRSIRDLSPE